MARVRPLPPRTVAARELAIAFHLACLAAVAGVRDAASNVRRFRRRGTSVGVHYPRAKMQYFVGMAAGGCLRIGRRWFVRQYDFDLGSTVLSSVASRKLSLCLGSEQSITPHQTYDFGGKRLRYMCFPGRYAHDKLVVVRVPQARYSVSLVWFGGHSADPHRTI